MLRAVARVAPYLTSYDYCSTGTHEDDAQTLSMMERVVDIATRVGRFDETVLFRGANANVSISTNPVLYGMILNLKLFRC
jgi:ERO1-like protein beta